MENTVKGRYEKILEIIQDELIDGQQTLVKRLEERYGIKTNQVQVSRDLKRLGILKRMIGEKVAYAVPDVDPILEILRLAIVDVVCNESQIVIRTVPALADFVGDFLDAEEDLPILGTLSGENTLFVAPKSVQKIKETCEQVKKALHFVKDKKK